MNDKNLNEWLFADIDDLIDCDYSNASKAEIRMTDNEIFETEIKCINRRVSGKCNGGTDCCKCDLLMNEKDIISAYERAIANSTLINRLQEEIDGLKHEREVLIEDIHHFVDKNNEQLEEIEELKIENKSLRSAANCYKLHYIEARPEAIKEFADRLKQKNEYYENGQGWEGRICYVDDIDNLVKEIEGED